MTEKASLLIDSRCSLGEGPFWHPGRQQLFWFDINNKAMFAATPEGEVVQRWDLPEIVAAGSIIDQDNLAVVTETGLKRFHLQQGMGETIMPVEADKTATRCNDSRVHPSGAFWIGTMDRGNEEGAIGALYHYRSGKLTPLKTDIRIPNATCFAPDGRTAYWTDTPTKQILKVATDPQTGLPVGNWEVFADVSHEPGYPDGAVVDSEGYLWNAKWGGACIVRHAPDGSIERTIEVPVSQVSCPAFGGPDLKTLFLTTANKTMSAEQLAKEPTAGGIFSIKLDIAGLAEPDLAL